MIVLTSISVQVILQTCYNPVHPSEVNPFIRCLMRLSELSVSACWVLRIPISVFQLCRESWLDNRPILYHIPVHPSGAGPSQRALCRLKGLSLQMLRAPRSLTHVHPFSPVSIVYPSVHPWSSTSEVGPISVCESCTLEGPTGRHTSPYDHDRNSKRQIYHYSRLEKCLPSGCISTWV